MIYFQYLGSQFLKEVYSEGFLYLRFWLIIIIYIIIIFFFWGGDGGCLFFGIIFMVSQIYAWVVNFRAENYWHCPDLRYC